MFISANHPTRFSTLTLSICGLDNGVHYTLWQWEVRRHRNKGARWVRARYFHTVDRRTWTFASKLKNGDQTKVVKLVYAIDTNIRRHRKIKADANPYDPIWETYFEERLTLRMGKELLGNRKAWQLWRNQNGHCPECDELITPETGWHIHHVVYRVYGGKDILSNLRLLHPNCHRKLHQRKLHQRKPSPPLPGSHFASL